METVRSIFRMAAALSWTVVAFLIRTLSFPVSWVAPAADRCWRRLLFKTWGRVMCSIIGVRIETHGVPPRPPFLQVTNHLSYLDTIVLGGLLGCVFVAKAEMERWPVAGSIVKGMGTIFVRRDRVRDAVRVNDLIERVIDSKEGVQIYAESTTSRGIDVRPFKTALLEPAARRQYPVHYAAITYRTPEGYPPAADVACWWTMVPFLKHALTLFRLPCVYATVTFGAAPIVSPDRKALAVELRGAVQHIFIPVAQGPHTMDKALREGLPQLPFVP